MYPTGEKRFLLVNYITIVALFILILAGGIVRSSGSGMGCPDWPKCFDRLIPPTDVSQLPANYHEKYLEGRIEKNNRFAKTLDVLGYGELASRIRDDKSILAPEEFNAAKTWTEYINRLIGAFTGLLLLGCLIFSTIYLKSHKSIFFLSLANVILVGFQAWLGSIVVSTNLVAGIVTVHMLVALAIVAVSIYTYFRARILRDSHLLMNNISTPVKVITVFTLLAVIFQIALGTEVREQIDAIASAMNNLNRPEWVSRVGANFNLHRSFSILIFSGIIMLVALSRKHSLKEHQSRYIYYILLLVCLQIITGLALSYLAIPAIAQALHLFLASLMFGALFYLVLILQRNKHVTSHE